jgi:hypothetical protein
MCIPGGGRQRVNAHGDEGILDTIIVQPPPQPTSDAEAVVSLLGGEYKPSTTIILSDSGLDHFRSTTHHTTVHCRNRPCHRPSCRHRPCAPNPLYNEAFPSPPQPTMGGTSMPTPTPPTLLARANNLPRSEMSLAPPPPMPLSSPFLLPFTLVSSDSKNSGGGDSFNPSTTVLYSLHRGSFHDKSGTLVVFVGIMALGPPIHRSLIADADIGHDPPTNPLGSSRGGWGNCFSLFRVQPSLILVTLGDNFLG